MELTDSGIPQLTHSDTYGHVPWALVGSVVAGSVTNRVRDVGTLLTESRLCNSGSSVITIYQCLALTELRRLDSRAGGTTELRAFGSLDLPRSGTYRVR